MTFIQKFVTLDSKDTRFSVYQVTSTTFSMVRFGRMMTFKIY